MFNAWRNFFVDPESGLPWATVMMFPWLKYGITPNKHPKVAVKIPETMKKTVSSAVQKEVKKETKKESKKPVAKKVATVKNKEAEKKLPVKAPATSLIKVEKKLPAVKTEVKKTTESVKAKPAAGKKSVAEKAVSKPVAEKKPVVVEKAVSKPATEKKTVVAEKTVSKPVAEKVKTPLVVKKNESVKTPETLPLDLPTPPKKTESKKKKVSSEEVQPVVIVERKFTPINTDKMPVKVQNLITQTNPSSPKAQIREAIVLLCADWAEPAAIADILKYKTTQLETLHLTPMVNSGQLLLRYPQDLTHPEQAYRAVSEKKSK